MAQAGQLISTDFVMKKVSNQIIAMSSTAKQEFENTPAPEISIWIDKYDDVFSDFDSRPFADRSLSDDFLREVQKMTSHKTKGNMRLKFHVLDDQRNAESESIIINNLNAHFRHIAEVLKNEQKQILKKGYMLLGFGFVNILVIFFLTNLSAEKEYLHGIILMLEPIAWFTTWTGLDNVFQNARKGNPALDFNSRMAFAEISFSPFGEPGAPDNTDTKQKTVIPLDNYNLRVA
jgi:hypothetical protein